MSHSAGAVIHDEEVFATKEVTCVGQVIGIVVADTEPRARAAAKLVAVEYEDLPAVFSIKEAIAAKSYFEVCMGLVAIVTDSMLDGTGWATIICA